MGYMEGALNSGAAVARRIAVTRRRRESEPGVSRHNLRLVLRARRDRHRVQGLRSRARGSRRGRQERAERAAGRLTPSSRRRRTVEARGGLAAAIAHRRLGQHGRRGAGRDGRKEPKIDIARRAALDLVDQFARYARRASGRAGAARPVRVQPPPRRARLPRSRPDGPARSRARRRGRRPARCRRRHADRPGDDHRQARARRRPASPAAICSSSPTARTPTASTPDRVAVAIGKRPDAERPSIYFVAFDIDASRFSGVRDAGGLVLSAANATELNDHARHAAAREDPRREVERVTKPTEFDTKARSERRRTKKSCMRLQRAELVAPRFARLRERMGEGTRALV